MKPYSRKNVKLRINNRKKFNAGARKVSWEFSPKGYPPKIVPLPLVVTRLKKAKRQGLTKDQFNKYAKVML